jgi:hypothetical protein
MPIINFHSVCSLASSLERQLALFPTTHGIINYSARHASALLISKVVFPIFLTIELLAIRIPEALAKTLIVVPIYVLGTIAISIRAVINHSLLLSFDRLISDIQMNSSNMVQDLRNINLNPDFYKVAKLTWGIALSILPRPCGSYNYVSRHFLSSIDRSPFYGQDGRAVIDLVDVHEHPLKYLEKDAVNGIPHRITFKDKGIEQRGIDSGGLSKQYVQELCRALIEKNILNIDGDGLPRIDTDEDARRFKIFCQFLEKLTLKNNGKSDPIFTGRLFSDVFFKLLINCFSNPTEQSKKIAVAKLISETDPAKNDLYEFIQNRSPMQGDIEDITSILNVLGEENLEFYDDSKLKDRCLSFFEPYYKAAQIFRSHRAVDPYLLDTSLPEAISSSIQGQPLVREKLAGCFKSTEGNGLTITEKVEWIQAKILNPDTDIKWCEQFLMAITGQKVIGPTLKIFVKEGLSPVPSASTCTNTLYLNPTVLTQKNFMTILISFLRQPDMI